jgi:Calcineurin-like phosphoesterase
MRYRLLTLAFVLIPHGAAAQSPTLEAAYVVLGAQGAVARAVLSNATQCPAITIDGARQAMSVRALPDTGPEAFFPVLVCELPLPSGVASASIENSSLPVPRTALKSMVAFGDTGCRLKAKKGSAKAKDQDYEDRGKFQDCNIPARWPFAQLAASVAAAKPDLVIHVGDYVYRESACPPRDQGCKGSPYGDDWATWKADFFAPAAPALLAAPWIMVRGNHEICKRAGAGYFRLLDPTPATSAPPCAELIRHYTVTLAGQSFIVLDSSNAADACPCDTAAYAAEFASMRPAPGAWLVSHRPVWGFRSHRKTINATLQQALPNGRLPDGIALALAGHIHVWEALSFADKRPPQFVLGTGGTLLSGRIKGNLTGEKIGGTTVSYGRADLRFGFTTLEPAGQGSWSATFRDIGGNSYFGCTVGAGKGACD